MKNVYLAVILSLFIIGNVYADVGMTSNASPVIVEISVSSAKATREITFPMIVRNVTVFNYDADDYIWINFRGSDTRGINNNSERFLLGPSSVVSLSDFQTPAITIVADTSFGDGEASPVSVIATY